MAFPILLVHRDKTEHIHRRLKKIEPVIRSCPVKAVTRIAAFDISFVGTFTAGSSLVGMTRNSVHVITYKYGIMKIGRFIDHLLMHKGIQHITVDSAMMDEIGIDSAHIVAGFGQFKFCFSLCSMRGRITIVLHKFIARIGCSFKLPAEQIFHRFCIRFVVIPADEVNGIAADLLVLVVPQISSNSYFL